MLTYKLNGNSKPLPMTEADSRVSEFMKYSMALVDLFHRDYELSSVERACMDSYLHLIELSYNSWKRRRDRLPPTRGQLQVPVVRILGAGTKLSLFVNS
jgi:hypothetical protein